MRRPNRLAFWVMTSIASSACNARCGEDSHATEAAPWDQIRSPQARQRGKALFQQNCVLCHGAAADGHGVRSMGLDRTPADFSNPQWNAASAPARIYHAIREGVPGSPMPSWSALSEAETWDLVAYLVSVSTQGP